MSRKHNPLGPGGTWKTGQRVPEDGLWVDQHGIAWTFEKGMTFPPTSTGRDGKAECAYRRLVAEDEQSA